MKKRVRKEISVPGKAVSRWFLISFLASSIIFCLSLFPLIIYCQNVFTELELKKSSQQLDSGITQLDNTVNSLVSASQTLCSDPRFVPLRYKTPDYTSIDVSVRNQMTNYLYGLVFPLTLVKDCALQFTQDIAVTPNNTFFNDYNSYYPDFFCVDDLTNDEWLALLAQNKTGFLSVHHINPNGGYPINGFSSKEYDALIYSTPWTKSSYLYACMDVVDIKEVMIAESDLDTCYLSIHNSDGELLYSDLPETVERYQSITQASSLGGLSITIHIPASVFTAKMKPLYLFLGAYCSVCIFVLMINIFISSRISSRPLMNIINMLENSSKFQENETSDNPDKEPPSSIHYGFHYIQDRFQQAEHNLEQYRNTIHTQRKVLQSRFLEKALTGQLSASKDMEQFLSYFPDFPKSYRLVLLRLQEQLKNNGAIYQDALYILQTFLESELPNAYQHQMSDTDLLLIITEADYPTYCQTLNFVINNINHEEPSYRLRGIASNLYQHLESLPTAYRQLQDMEGLKFPDTLSQVCTVSDYTTPAENDFNMTEMLTLYTAISYGNHDMAAQKLQSYSAKLLEGNRHIYELIRSVLLCIRMEHPAALMDISIPAYSANKNLYAPLEKIIRTFCNIIQQENQTSTDPFVQELLNYIDTHFTEYSLCLASLEEQFDCSASKIQKTFKNNMGITISDYIEKKRMKLANELLFQKEKSITEIALECGFSNSNSFYKAYQRVYGIAPSSVKDTMKKGKNIMRGENK